jgi:probable HAF family extracellular repeat protein
MKMRRTHAASVGLLVAVLLAPCRLWALDYTMELLPLPGGYVNSYARAINDTGAVLFTAQNSEGRDHSFVWTPGDGTFEIPKPTGVVHFDALDMNRSGKVVGNANYTTGIVGFSWDAITGYHELSQSSSTAQGVNDQGKVVGSVAVGPEMQHAALWDSAGALTDLGALPSSRWAQACSISSNGVVVGDSRIGNWPNHPLIWDSTLGIRDLGLSRDSLYGYAHDVNDLGHAAGSQYVHGIDQATVWYGVGQPLVIGALSSGSPSYARAINDSDQAVGYSYVGDGHLHAFVWDAVEGMSNLGVGQANAINQYGLIVGITADAQGNQRATLWTPIPEPAPFWGLMIGLVGLAALKVKSMCSR